MDSAHTSEGVLIFESGAIWLENPGLAKHICMCACQHADTHACSQDKITQDKQIHLPLPGSSPSICFDIGIYTVDADERCCLIK